MSQHSLVYAPNTPTWAQVRSIEYSYQVSLIADNPRYLRQFMVATQAMQAQSLLTAHARLAEVNRGILGIQQDFGELTSAVQRGFADLSNSMQEGFDQLGGIMQDGFSLLALELQRQNALMLDIAKLHSTKLEGEAREIRNSALSAVREGCSPDAFDQEGSLREAQHLFRITVEHPMGMRDYVAWFNIGWLHWKLDGNMEAAEKAFATAVRQSMEKKDAYHVMAARHLAYIRFLLRKTDGADQAIRLALQNAGDDTENLFTQMLITAQAKNGAELVTAFRALITDHPAWLAACLTEPELNPFQAQLQPVVDTLMEDARMRITAAMERVDALLSDAADMARAMRRDTSLSAATHQQVAASKELISGMDLHTVDWPTMHRLVQELTTLRADVSRELDGIRPVFNLISEMIPIPAGEFLYGEQQGSKYLPAFSIAKHPVTVAQYRQFCLATDHAMPPAPSWGWQDEHPIVNVSWEDATAFATWVGMVLPTEEEWEKAARGTAGREYPWGNEWDAAKCCNSVEQAAGKTAPVGQYPAGASPYGIEDMAGNVMEWCDSWYVVDNTRVLRGGCWRGNTPGNFRASSRDYLDPSNWFNHHGFRCALRP